MTLSCIRSDSFQLAAKKLETIVSMLTERKDGCCSYKTVEASKT